MKNLIILRAGKNSLHVQWLEGGLRNWDMILCPFQEIDTGDLPSFLIYGQKWSGLYEFMVHNDIWKRYDYICFPDDDIAASAQTWSDFFDQCRRLNVMLAAPALTPNSYYSHEITLQNISFAARATTFVEIMNPCVSRDVLGKILPTMQLTRAGTGFGLDILWPAMLSYDGIWIIDQTPVHHTRPIGSARNQTQAALSRYDLGFIKGFGIPFQMVPLGGVTKDGRYINADDDEFVELNSSGYSYLQNRAAQFYSTEKDRKNYAKPSIDPNALAKLYRSLAHLNRSEINLARNKPALISSSSQWSWTKDKALEASGANDGRINGRGGFHTALEINPWWQVDLEAICAIDRIEIYNRLDQKSRIINLNILSSVDGLHWRCLHEKRDDKIFGGADGDPLRIEFSTPEEVQVLRIEAIGETYLHLDQVEVFGSVLETNITSLTQYKGGDTLKATSVVMLEQALHSPRGEFILESLLKKILVKIKQ